MFYSGYYNFLRILQFLPRLVSAFAYDQSRVHYPVPERKSFIVNLMSAGSAPVLWFPFESTQGAQPLCGRTRWPRKSTAAAHSSLPLQHFRIFILLLLVSSPVRDLALSLGHERDSRRVVPARLSVCHIQTLCVRDGIRRSSLINLPSPYHYPLKMSSNRIPAASLVTLDLARAARTGLSHCASFPRQVESRP